MIAIAVDNNDLPIVAFDEDSGNVVYRLTDMEGNWNQIDEVFAIDVAFAQDESFAFVSATPSS